MKYIRTFIQRSLLMSSILIIGTLISSGCSSPVPDSDESTSNGDETQNSMIEKVYQFDDVRAALPTNRAESWSAETPVIVQLSEELKGAAPQDADIAIDHYTVTAESIRSGICRVDIGIEYAPRGKENINDVREPFGTTETENLVYSLFGSDELASNVREVDSIPENNQISVNSTYVTRDSSKVVFLEECSDDGGNNFINLDFPHLDENRSIEIFARARLALESENDAPDSVRAVVQGDVNATTDSSGNWHQQ